MNSANQTAVETFRLHTFLHQMIKEVNVRQRALETECDILRSLLKPWPIKKKTVDSQNETERDTNLDKAQDQIEIVLSAEESQALTQVEQILNKARKTLNSKHKECDKSHTQQGTTADKSLKADANQLEIANDKRNKFTENDALNEKSGRPLEKNDVKSSVVQLRTEKVIKSTLSASSSKYKRAAVVLPNKSSRVAGVGLRPKATENHRPGSAQKLHLPARPASSRGHVPAHLQAPFKTEPNIKIQKYNKHQTITKQRQTGRRPASCTVNKLQALPRIASEQKSSVQDSESFNDTYRDNTNNNSDRDSTHFKELFQRDKLEQPLQLNIEHDRDVGVKGEQSNSVLRPTECSSPTTRTFTLQENGATIKLPSKLSQLVRKNQKLRDKCLAAKIHKKVTEQDAAEQFINKLDEETEVSQELWTRVRALTCLSSHKVLFETLNSLQLEQVKETSPLCNIYRAKKTLEFILTTFAELQIEAEHFCKAKFTDPLSLKHQQDKFPEISWFSNTDKKRDYLLEVILNSDKKWTTLKFVENYLHLQILLNDTVQLQWGSALSHNQLDPSFIQALHGLMSTSGLFLPAFIKNIQNCP